MLGRMLGALVLLAAPPSSQELNDRTYAQWRDHIRPAQLRRAPLCEVCAERGVTTLATQVDHRIRPMGDYHLQRDPNNLRSLCAGCHSRKTMADQRGFSKDVDSDGYPIDPNHFANKPRRQTHNTGGERKT